MKRLLLAAWLCAAEVAGAAQGIYRCGNTYSQQPCADGKAVAADDARSPAQRAEAAQVAADERQRAEALARERREHKAAPALAGSLSAQAPAPKASAVHAAKPPKKHDKGKAHKQAQADFAATQPGTGSAARKLKTPE